LTCEDGLPGYAIRYSGDAPGRSNKKSDKINMKIVVTTSKYPLNLGASMVNGYSILWS
jgi:hypothetical protein